MLERITKYESAGKYGREKSQKSKFSYNGDFNFKNTLLFIKTKSKVTSLEKNKIMFRVY